MHLFYVETISPLTILDEEESRHFKVLRIKDNEEVLVSDGKGKIAKALTYKISKKQVILKTFDIKIIDRNKDFYLTIAIAPTKHNERIEWFIEKAVEIGIDKIIFIKTKNTERNKINISRFKKIAKSAGKQSLTPVLPVIENITSFRHIVNYEKKAYKHIALCDAKKTIKEILLEKNTVKEDHIVLIGPEGGFTAEEINIAITKKWQPVLLSHKRLRTETAGIFVATAYSLFTE